jgi:o-succinylbenzoate---CoA ligase
MQVEAWLRRAARTAPTVTALQTPHLRLSYTELLAGAEAGACQLSDLGARAGERVAIALEPGVGFAMALHACLLLGAVAVPVDLRLKAAERERILLGANVLIEEPLSMESSTEDPFAVAPTGRERHELDAVCLVVHTSGTTSLPRAIELTYGNFLWSALGSGVALGVDPQERWLCALPLSHVGGLSILMRSAIYATTAVVHERFDTAEVLGALMEDRITLVSLVSTTLARLLDAGLSDPPHLRCALTGGGPVPSALVERARVANVAVAETYGLTECCSAAATAPLAMLGDGRRGAEGFTAGFSGQPVAHELGAGVPLFCTCVETVEPGGGRAHEQELGEIVLSGPTIAPCARSDDGRLHTGDLGWLDEHGLLHVRGRLSDTIVSGGENVAPSEVEEVLASYPGVLEAAVVGREHPEWGEAVSAIVVLAPHASVEEALLREHCASRLAAFKVPKSFTLVSDRLPRTRSGKLLRREL